MLSFIALALAATVGAPTPDSTITITEFSARIRPDFAAPNSMIGATGGATVSLTNDALHYQVALAGVKHVTNVALIDEGRAVELYDVTDTRGNTLDIEGVIGASQVEDVPFQELSRDLLDGRARVVVFTTDEPGGVMGGKLEFVGAMSVPAPAPKATPKALVS